METKLYRTHILFVCIIYVICKYYVNMFNFQKTQIHLIRYDNNTCKTFCT